MQTCRNALWGLVLSGVIASSLNAEEIRQSFRIEQTGRGVAFDTGTGIHTVNGYSRPGLISASSRNGQTFLRYREVGSFRETVSLDGKLLIDGTDVGDMSRISGFRLAQDGSYVYLRSTKGPGARVELYQDGKPVKGWPRGTYLRIISFDRKKLMISKAGGPDEATQFFRFDRQESGWIIPEPQLIGVLRHCVFQSAREANDKLLLQAFCSHETGSDILSMDLQSGEITPVLATEHDEHFGSSLMRSKDGVILLQVAGDENGRRAFQAITGIFLSSIGETMSMASDASGTQSWGQSFRLRALAALAQKIDHPIFGVLARHSMRQTLSQQNGARKIYGRFNPPCAWASRIYSSDGNRPLSLLVNQAMISSSLIAACDGLGAKCGSDLRYQIMSNARCLVTAFEDNFDDKSGLYRVHYGAPFRFDGIWAPWNWQMAWTPVLEAVGRFDERSDLVVRAHNIADRFRNSWYLGDKGAFWRYWTPEFYKGWTKADHISTMRPKQSRQAPMRWEDISHAGISLLGLQGLDIALSGSEKTALQKTINRIFAQGISVARDLDGSGPRSARWLPGSGFDAYATQEMDNIYSRNLPGSRSGDQLLAFANLIDEDKPVRLRLTLFDCNGSGCRRILSWPINGLSALVRENPLFTIDQY